eukprot:TRINITY_DN10169_c0_g1_i2.p1 TRINITY_DN10169_c0_g1~~TRINITY_DN10169_c0_g1_i2.p1  ORF type:complete len:307 (+),score=60.26 TRINITY_DN10169_c0_g1_i2:79-921(+)
MPARRAAAGDQAGPRAGAARKADAAAAPRAKRRRVGAPAAAAKLGSPQNESRGAVRFTAPTGWEPLWDAVAAMRAKGGAPVDGCDDIADKTQGEDVRRYQVLVALMLSSQTRDEQTAAAMSRLRQEGLTPRKISRTSEARLRELIKNVSFYNNKAKYIKAATDILLAEYGGGTPRSVEQCVRLPGVGPKMAHLFVQSAWGRTEGVGVDVHVHRICNRWGWAACPLGLGGVGHPRGDPPAAGGLAAQGAVAAHSAHAGRARPDDMHGAQHQVRRVRSSKAV